MTADASDPQDMPRWSLLMALGWVATRDIDVVRSLHPGRRNADGDAPSLARLAATLAYRVRALELSSLGGVGAEYLSRRMSPDAAERELLLALSDGLPAYALGADGEPDQVAAHKWEYLEIRDPDHLAYPSKAEPAYRQVTIDRLELFEKFPAAPAPSAALEQKKPAAKKPPANSYDEALASAIATLWPEGMPAGMRQKARNNQIRAAINPGRPKAVGLGPGDKTISRYFSRLSRTD